MIAEYYLAIGGSAIPTGGWGEGLILGTLVFLVICAKGGGGGNDDGAV